MIRDTPRLRRDGESDGLQRVEEDLEEREALVLRSHFGLDNGVPKTYREIGKRLKLTRERARQIERAALLKLLKKISAA